VPLQEFSAASPGIEALEVAQAVADLAEEHRTVVLLGVVEGFTCREMAEILSIPIGTVMSRLSRARHTLRERLAPSVRYAGKGAS
jgi:RNA polymerase sigma-70 factor, ECF subfamily